MLILRTGSIMHVGFEKVFLLSNDSLLEKSEVISTYTYRVGIRGGQMSLSSAIGLFNSVVNFVILVLVNWVSRRLGETSLW
jgi:putative aldouronate transport system permease protein